jgi:hypothetical protein
MKLLRSAMVWTLVAVGPLVILSSCLLDSSDRRTIVDPWPYRPQTSPENVVYNLQASYLLREIDEYAKLLAPEFIFLDQPVDAQELAERFWTGEGDKHLWTRDEDIAGTRALFEATVVASISIDLDHGPAEAAEDMSLPDNTKKIRINQLFLHVDETSGVTWVVTQVQEFFSRPGDPDLGENPDSWFLVAWREIPSATAPSSPASVRGTTWADLKVRY